MRPASGPSGAWRCGRNSSATATLPLSIRSGYWEACTITCERVRRPERYWSARSSSRERPPARTRPEPATSSTRFRRCSWLWAISMAPGEREKSTRSGVAWKGPEDAETVRARPGWPSCCGGRRTSRRPGHCSHTRSPTTGSGSSLYHPRHHTPGVPGPGRTQLGLSQHGAVVPGAGRLRRLPEARQGGPRTSAPDGDDEERRRDVADRDEPGLGGPSPSGRSEPRVRATGRRGPIATISGPVGRGGTSPRSPDQAPIPVARRRCGRRGHPAGSAGPAASSAWRLHECETSPGAAEAGPGVAPDRGALAGGRCRLALEHHRPSGPARARGSPPPRRQR